MLFFKKKTSDQDIIVGIQAGGSERRVFENLLYEKYLYLIEDGVRKHQLSEDDCASAYSDAVISVLNNINSNKFEGRSELKTYLYQIFSNKCVDLIRKNTTNKESINNTFALDDILAPLPDHTRSIIEEMMQKNDIEILQNRLKTIGEKCQQIVLAWGDGYSDEEIAQNMGYNTPAVAKTSRLRCLEKLKEMYLIKK